jgi:hypothetical protein
MQDEPHLSNIDPVVRIGQRRTATGAVGGELALVALDQVLGLTACIKAPISSIAAWRLTVRAP